MAKPNGPATEAVVMVAVPRILVPVLGLAALALVAGLYNVSQANRALRQEVANLTMQRDTAESRVQLLTGAAARKNKELFEVEGEADTLRQQVDAVDMQLDGIAFLHDQFRAELGLPTPTVTPPAGGAPLAPGQPGASPLDAGSAVGGGEGGPYDSSVTIDDRLALARARLGWALADVYALWGQAHARPFRSVGASNAPAPPDTGRLPANWPARGPITSPFGWREFRGKANYHSGIDIALAYGSPVAATGDGTVVGSGWQPGYGLCVLVQHGQGYATLFAHLSQSLVQLGDSVEPGSAIGLSGSSGNSTGPHLHYEIWHNGSALDPRPFMDTGPPAGSP
ncbi:MAG: M23 family metallopeptidase [Ardenticatenales bacterium]